MTLYSAARLSLITIFISLFCDLSHPSPTDNAKYSLKFIIYETITSWFICCSRNRMLQLPAGFAQQLPPVPVDPNVRIGKLDNGLTYYIQ